LLSNNVLKSLLAVIIGVGIVASLYLLPRNADTPVYVPTFQRGDCFRLFGADEAWQQEPDGIIERVGKRNYLVIWKAEADKHGGTKLGSTLEIKVFDQLNEKIACPDTWIKHTHGETK